MGLPGRTHQHPCQTGPHPIHLSHLAGAAWSDTPSCLCCPLQEARSLCMLPASIRCTDYATECLIIQQLTAHHGRVHPRYVISKLCFGCYCKMTKFKWHERRQGYLCEEGPAGPWYGRSQQHWQACTSAHSPGTCPCVVRLYLQVNNDVR